MNKFKIHQAAIYTASLLIAATIACSPLALLPSPADDVTPSELVVSQTRLSILESFPVQVQLTINGELPDSCTNIIEVQSQRAGNTFHVAIETQRAEGDCLSGPVPFEQQIQLDVNGLPAGEYQVEVQGVTQSFSLAVDNAIPTETAAEPALSPVGEGVSILLPAEIGGQAQATVLPSQAAEGAPPFANYPDKIKVSFPAYPLTDTFHSARIELYPLAETMSMNQAAADTISELRTLLQNPPTEMPEPLPFLPIFNAGAMIQAQEQIISTPSVEGVRFLTQFGQALYPINNAGLFYTFQGITTDESHYVLAIFPVNHPDLPPTGDDYLGQDPLEFYDAAESYFAETQVFLDEQPSSIFMPDISVLDQVVGSLTVE